MLAGLVEKGFELTVCDSRKLIDVSAPSRARVTQVNSNSTASSKATEAAPARVNYATLLDATFGDVSESAGASTTGTLTTSFAADESDTEMATGNAVNQHAVNDNTRTEDEEDQNTLEAQKQWLRDILKANTEERQWDWITVRGIEGPLMVSFDDF